MRLSLRLIVCLMLSVAVVSLLFAGYQIRSKRRSQRLELQRRSQVLAESLQGNAESLLQNNSSRSLQRLTERFANREHLIGIAVFDKDLKPLAIAPTVEGLLGARPWMLNQAVAKSQEISEFQRQGPNYFYVLAVPLRNGEETIGGLAVVSDAKYIEADSARAWRSSFLHFLIQAFLVALVTLLVVRWSVEGPISRATQWMKALRAGRVHAHGTFPGGDLFRPLAQEVAHLADSLSAARKAAEQEASLREASESLWTAGTTGHSCAQPAQRKSLVRSLQSGTVFPFAAKRFACGNRSGQRSGNRAGTHSARL